jgi:hypothetical protein
VPNVLLHVARAYQELHSEREGRTLGKPSRTRSSGVREIFIAKTGRNRELCLVGRICFVFSGLLGRKLGCLGRIWDDLFIEFCMSPVGFVL